MELKDVTHVENIRFGDETSVVIIDQTKLPNETVYLTRTKPEEMYLSLIHIWAFSFAAHKKAFRPKRPKGFLHEVHFYRLPLS